MAVKTVKKEAAGAAKKTSGKAAKSGAGKPAAAKTASKTVAAKTAGAKTIAAKTAASNVNTAKAGAVRKTVRQNAVSPKAAAANGVYDESKVKTLSSLEHIRLRTGMYIGRLGDGSNPDDGIYVLLKEVIDNSIDEFIMGNGKLIETQVKDGSVKIRDYGRGIPLGKLVECVSVINTGAKYNDDVFQFSVGLNGVGTKAVNALSSHFRVVSIRDGEFAEAVFERGLLKNQRKGKLKENQKNGTFVEFTPDNQVFGDYQFNLEFIERRIQNYAYL
ncbi:MAG: ATP-binding protein, partial [Treponema sp.]|nr:ATP-binding protein [Treponema sp.]